ncbi:MAG: cell envelope integrity EipB family protein [Hyphomicrobiales bacterium]|nr:cell envelope integrity EipB family protein [Hyphomicrobiales bacterium]
MKTHAFAAAALIMASVAPAGADEVRLAPHRAVYDIKLLRSEPGSNIAALDGFLSIEFRGSPCEGYVQSTQLITNTVDWNGRGVVTDMRASSWEDGGGEKLHFRSKRFVNAQEAEAIEGDATRDPRDKAVQISLKSPTYSRWRTGGGTMFPTQHSIAVIKAAMRGQFALQADIYDGSDKAEKYHQTTTVIGKQRSGGDTEIEGLAGAGQLGAMAYWPITVSYFDSDKKGAILPVYEIAYRLYVNGVSSNLVINYGNFSVEGSLSQIEFLKPAACGSAESKPVKR